MKEATAITVLASTLLLAGCASYPFDAGAIPAAQAQRAYDRSQCRTRTTAGEFATSVQATDCVLAADRKFVVTIKVRDMRLFNDYANNMSLVAARLDQKLYTAAEAQQRWAQLDSGFANALTAAYQRADADNTTAESLSAAFLMGAAQGNAAQPKPMFCSSTVNGQVVNTICN